MKSLFSPTTDEVLSLFLRYPKTKFYANQIVQITGKYPNSITQSLKRLGKMGLLVSDKIGSYRFYALNARHPLLPELRRIMIKIGRLPARDWLTIFKQVLTKAKPDHKLGQGVNQAVITGGKWSLALTIETETDTSIIGSFKLGFDSKQSA